MKKFILQDGFVYEVSGVDPFSRFSPCRDCSLYDSLHDDCGLSALNGFCEKICTLRRVGKLLNSVEEYEE